MHLLIWLYPLFFFTTISPGPLGNIELRLKNIEKEKGSIRLAVYDNRADFEAQGQAIYGKVITDFSGKETSIQLPELSFGQYAIAVYHDLNNNNKLDKTLVGIPKEPYAFSNNPKVKWNPPTFEESKFQLREGELKMEIQLQFWSNY
ncbi:MAG TPA: DUF2141 domain-containing protein [Saprospiraceae bacterium]|nr:DUF2141 domain-containing protein [Saprospiraceae bacterium]